MEQRGTVYNQKDAQEMGSDFGDQMMNGAHPSFFIGFLPRSFQGGKNSIISISQPQRGTHQISSADQPRVNIM